MITRSHLEAFLEIADRRSIQAAARATGRSRATYHRYLTELREALDAPELFRRAPGQREGLLTPEGEQFAERARALLRTWDRQIASARETLAQSGGRLRVGAIAGALDLIVDPLIALKKERPDLPLKIFELTGEMLLERVAANEIDLGFGTAPQEGVPRRLHFEVLGPLELALIAPQSLELPDPVRIADLDGVPMVVPRAGAARENLQQHFADHPDGPFTLNAVCEVESTPRMVELVARGFGAAVVSRFRTAFLPPGVKVRTLDDGPPPISAGAFTRKGAPPSGDAARLIERARDRFESIAHPKRTKKATRVSR